MPGVSNCLTRAAFHRYRLRHDYLFLQRGEIIQRSVGGDFYPTTLGKWAREEFRIPASTVESNPNTFALWDVSDEEWELMNLDLSNEL